MLLRWSRGDVGEARGEIRETRDKRQNEETRDKKQETRQITKTMVMYKLSSELDPIF